MLYGRFSRKNRQNFGLDVDLDAFPQAKCNDGSGAVFWVRRYETLGAQSVENQNKWWIHLPGGGAAVRGFGAADRYCTNASRMSTLDIDREPIAPRSIAAGPPENRFRDWNHVFIYNCSSDRFVGAAGAVATSGQPTGASDPVDYTIHYNGAHILDAVLDTLKRHDGVVSYIDREGKTRVMPNLDAATTVIFAGEGAGANGVVHRADDVHASLLATNTNCVGESCDVDVGAVVDGAYLPNQETWDHSTSLFCTGDLDQDGLVDNNCTYEELLQFRADTQLHGPMHDQSCLDYHAGEEWRCLSRPHVLENHVTTPFFVRTDLQDRAIYNIQEAINYGDPPGNPLTASIWGQIMHDQLTALATIDATAEEGTGNLGPGIVEPGVFGPQCEHHSALFDTYRSHEVLAPSTAGDLSFNQTLWNWYTGQDPQTAIVPFDEAGVRYELCPCNPDVDTACLFEGAFKVEGQMTNFENPPVGFKTVVMSFPGARAESDKAVFFESFDPGNFEVGVKMVDACTLPSGHPLRFYWAFLGGLTNAGTEMRITDTVTDQIYTWSNPSGSFPLTEGDTSAFPCVEGIPSVPCVVGDTIACLLSGRFQVEGEMTNFANPPQIFPTRVMSFPENRAESEQAVFFESFDPGNFEVGVKMVNGCGFPKGHPLHFWWVFYGGLTNAETYMKVTQLETGLFDEWLNPAGTFPRSEGRTQVFPCVE